MKKLVLHEEPAAISNSGLAGDCMVFSIKHVFKVPVRTVELVKTKFTFVAQNERKRT